MQDIEWRRRPHPSVEQLPHVTWHEVGLTGGAVLRLVESREPKEGLQWTAVLDADEGYNPVQELGAGPQGALEPQPETLEDARQATWMAYLLARLEGRA